MPKRQVKSKYEEAGGIPRPSPDHPFSSPFDEYMHAEARPKLRVLAETWNTTHEAIQQISLRRKWREQRDQYWKEQSIDVHEPSGVPLRHELQRDADKAVELWHQGKITIEELREHIAALGLATAVDLVGSKEKSIQSKAVELLLKYGFTQPALLSESKLRFESAEPALLLAALQELSEGKQVTAKVAALIGEGTEH